MHAMTASPWAKWMPTRATGSAQEYGRALLRTKRLLRLHAIVTEFDRSVATEHGKTMATRSITYEPVECVTDTRLTLKEAIAFHPLTLAHIAVRAHLPAFYLEQLANCQEAVPSLDTRDIRNCVATALDMLPDAIRWPMYRVAEVA